MDMGAHNNVSIWFTISLQFLIHKGKGKQEDENKTSYEKIFSVS
jgi:hypothetical protein